MEIPVSIDFSKIYAEKVLFSETIQYKILKSMDESEWKQYQSKMLKESVNVSYDALTDAFIATPKTKLTLTESRDRINESKAKYTVQPDSKGKTEVLDQDGKQVHVNTTEEAARAWVKLQGEGKEDLTEAVGKKELLLDGNDEDEEDFDSSVEGLLNFDDDDDDDDDDEEVSHETEESNTSAEANMGVLVDKLEDLINKVLDSRESSAKGQFEEIPAGEASDIGDFSPEQELPVPDAEDNKTEVDELLVSEFPQVQNKIDVIKDRIESEVSYADYLNGETDIPYDTSAPEVGAPEEEFDTPEEIDMLNKRSDDYDAAGEEVLLDDDFERNAELTSGGSIYEDIGDEEIENAVDAEVDAIEPVTATVNAGGTPIQIVLTGIVLTQGEVGSIIESATKQGVAVKKISNDSAQSLNIIVECNNKNYKINYTDVSKNRNKMPFSIKHEKFQSLNEALKRITAINMKDIKEKENFKKFVTEDILAKESKSVEGSDIFEGYQNVKDIGGWNVKALGNVSLKTGVNEVLSNITTNQKDKNTLVKTNEGQYFLIKGSLNEKSKEGVSKQLVDMDRKCEYGTVTVIGTYQNSLKGLGQIMEQIKRTNIPLLIWK